MLRLATLARRADHARPADYARLSGRAPLAHGAILAILASLLARPEHTPADDLGHFGHAHVVGHVAQRRVEDASVAP